MPNSSEATLNIAEQFQQIYNNLSEQDDLSPQNSIVNTELNKLVRLVFQQKALPESEQTLLEKLKLTNLFENLPNICAQAEYEMERWWTRYISSSPTPKEAIKDFWYINSYKELCHIESTFIKRIQPHRILFLGSGPLPITVLLHAKAFPKTQIVAVDANANAIKKSQRFLKLQGISNIEHIECQAQDVKFQTGDLPIFASLLQGHNIYKSLKESSVQHIIVRDSTGLVQLLYHPAQQPTTPFVKTAELSSSNSLNTVILFSKQ